jgi:DNA-binding beta-propeller fold protein YncE
MAVALSLALAAQTSSSSAHARIYYLDIGSGGRVLSANDDGTDVQVISKSRASGPDGIAIDAGARHVYWTNMGAVSLNDGTIERADLDGSQAMTIVPAGGTFTPKQLKIDAAHGRLYWSDREGMRVMRARLDGSEIETLVETARGDEARRDARNWCVGIALDVARGKVYWTQKGSGGNGRILRANLEIPKGETPDRRSDIEVLFDGLPEPIDLDADLSARLLYWTDRGDPPRGNTLNRAPMDPPRGFDPSKRDDDQILFGGLKEGIGVALDFASRHVFVTDLGGNVYRANLDGTDRQTILAGQGVLTGITVFDPGK